MVRVALVVVSFLSFAALSHEAGPPAGKGPDGHPPHGHKQHDPPQHDPPKHDPQKEAEMAKGREQVDADGVVRRGKPLSKEGTVLSVAEAIAQAEKIQGKTVKIGGKVESVCQKMGCWFVIQGEKPEQTIRISSKGHDIFVPKSSKGLFAVVEGELVIKTLSQKQAQHFEDERELAPGEKRKVIAGEVKEYSFVVVGLELKKSG